MADDAPQASRAAAEPGLIAVIADEDTVTGFLLAGVGNVDARRKPNFLIVDSKTSVQTIEATFKEFTHREDVSILLISQYIADMIRTVVNDWTKPIPAILEIPSKEHPYDMSQDSILMRVSHLIGADGSVAAI
eukprot:CAMPEP_0198198406 /NCGR_PEP_ID=MMETSP1445-20131203/1880_1 /TAXON_ID=36898 /ORGANISM="Pyramimonas sp., Strain CCMP2087" /LENGTH=132 /DNA_ID=CAMNT_0043867963 /DNA_START=67 /DNA_END=465 /DNA_ORIENTATION=-